MAKKNSGQNMASPVTKHQLLHGIKNGSVKKDKKQKFKNTPTGKITLVDVKTQNKNAKPQKNLQKNTDAKNTENIYKEKLKQSQGKGNFSKKQNFAKGYTNEKQDVPKGKQNSPKGKQSSNELQKKQGKKNVMLQKKLEVDDSDSDIDEGILPQQEISMEDKTSEDESDTDVPDILGTSLADDSDVDDEDFEDEENEGEEESAEEEDDDDDDDDDDEEVDDDDDDDSNASNEEETVKHKGITMFKGTKSNAEDQSLETDEDDDDEEDEDDDDEDIEMDSMDTSLLESNEDDDDDDDDDDDEDEDENKSVSPGLKALLEKSMTDDDDDKDFNEEGEDDEDDDISDEEEEEDSEENDEENAVKAVQKKGMKEKAVKNSNGKDASKSNEQVDRKKLSPEEQEELDKRTIFIDNIPKETKEATLKKVFGQYGPIVNLRLRGFVPKNPNVPKKVAAITKDTHPKSLTVVAYIHYKSEESAKKALCLNGKKFEGNYINVKIVAISRQKPHDIKKSVFIGNLRFGMDNPNPIWELFGKCGEIESVRLVRDRRTRTTRGFGYVNFKSVDAVALALKLDGTELNGRPVRVQPCRESSGYSPKSKGEGKKRFSNESNDNRPSKKFRGSRKAVTRPAGDEEKVKQKKPQKDNTSPMEKKFFQGQKADVKNKKKEGKFDKKKKELAGKLMAKSNKQKT